MGSWSKEIKRQVLAALRAGDTQEVIYREYGVPLRTISRWSAAAGIAEQRETMKDRICIEEGCNEPAQAKELCRYHRHVAWKTRPLTDEDFRKAEQRLLSRSFATACGCRIWTGCIINREIKGDCKYGGFTALGETQAHRVSYRLSKGEIPEGFEVDHLCSVTLCVEGDHLEAVPKRENIRRTWERGRGQNRSKMTALEYGAWAFGART